MLRAVCILGWWMAAAALAAPDTATSSTPIAAPARTLPAPTNLPKKSKNDDSLQLRGADSELSVGLAEEKTTPSVFDDLSTDNSAAIQKAQLMLKRNLLDDVTLTYKSKVGLANTAPTKTNTASAPSGQSQSSTDLKWNVSDDLALTSSHQMDQIFEFQRAEPSRVRESIESRYRLNPGTALGLGVNNENYYTDNTISFARQTTTGQLQQKLGNLPLQWTSSPSLISETAPLDAAQNRAGNRLDQSLLWNINPDLTWNVGSGWVNWNYDTSSKQQLDRTLYSQWTRQLRSNLKLTFRTDLETIETATDSTTTQREDKFKLSLGQQLTLTDDVSAAFDLRQEYQRDINSTWSPADRSATLSIQKKF